MMVSSSKRVPRGNTMEAHDQVNTERDDIVVVTNGQLIDEPSVMISIHVNGGSLHTTLTEREALQVKSLIDVALSRSAYLLEYEEETA